MVAPIWLRPRLGPYLRRERDKRNYFVLFGRGKAVSGLRRAWLLSAGRRSVRTFETSRTGDLHRFNELWTSADLLRRRLIAMTRPRYRPLPPPKPFIGVHVRLGDFKRLGADEIERGVNNTRLPAGWYVDRLTTLREALGPNVPAMVFSDGADAELTQLLSLANTRRAPRQSAVTDLLAIGHAAALIASGSGFSAWGAFLGNVPRLSHPAQRKGDTCEDPSRDIESCAGAAIPETFLAHVRERLG
jgi:hypothetical protein